MCRRRTLVCLGGGLLAFGSSLYSSYSSSELDPPWSKRVPLDRHADAAGGGSKQKGNGVGRGAGGGTGILNCTGPIRGDGVFPCSMGSGTGCPYFVSTAEWGRLAEVLAVTPLHAIDTPGGDGTGNGDACCDDSDSEEDEDTDGSNGGIGGDSLRGGSSVLPEEHTASKAYAPPWLPDDLHSKEELLVTPAHGGHGGEDADGGDGDAGGGNGDGFEGGDDHHNDDDDGSSVLPKEHEVTRAYIWRWPPGNVHETEGNVRATQGLMVARNHGQSSAPVPNPVYLLVYVVVMLVAVYKGNPRRGSRRSRRLQRRRRSSRCAQRRVGKVKRLHSVAVAMPFFVARFPFLFRLTHLDPPKQRLADDPSKQRLPGVNLFSESRLEILENGDTYFILLDTNTTTCGNTEQKTEILGSWENMEMIQPKPESAAVRVAAAAKKKRKKKKKKTTADVNLGLLGKGKQRLDVSKTKPELELSNREGCNTNNQLLPNTPAVSLPTHFPPAPAVTPMKPIQAVSLAILAKSTIGTALGFASCSAPEANVDTAIAPATPLASSNKITVELDPPGTRTRVTKKKNPETPSKAADATSPTLPFFSPVRTFMKLVKAVKLFGATPAKSPASEVTDSASRAAKAVEVDTAVIPAAPSASSKNIAGVVGPSGTSTEDNEKNKRQTSSTAVTATTAPTLESSVPLAASEKSLQVVQQLSAGTLVESPAGTVLNISSCAANARNVDTAAVTVAASMKTTESTGELELSGKSVEAIEGKQHQTTTAATATTTAASAATEANFDTAVIAAAVSTSTNETAGNAESFGDSKVTDKSENPQTATSATATTAATLTLPGPDVVSSKSSSRDVSSKDDQAVQSPRPTPEPRPLTNDDGLFESKNPAIKDVRGWFSGISINIDPDGNCFGTAWMVAALVWAAQSPARLQHLISELEEAGRPGQAFECLDEKCKGYVDGLVVYVKGLKDEWTGHASHDSTCATKLAVGVVTTFLGTNCQGYESSEKEAEDPTWLKLKWGVAIAARAMDAWTASMSDSELDTAKLRRLREPVVLDFEKLQATPTSSPDGGANISVPPAVDVLRPGGSMRLLTGLVVNTYSRGQRITEDYTKLFEGATNTPSKRTTTGIAVLQAGLPHFDVVVTPSADVLFITTLAAIFEIPEPAEDDPKALETLKHNVESQLKTTPEQLGKFVGDQEQRDAQIAAMQAFEDKQAAREREEQQAHHADEDKKACEAIKGTGCAAAANLAGDTQHEKARDVQPKPHHHHQQQQQQQQSGNNGNSKKRGKRTRNRKRR